MVVARKGRMSKWKKISAEIKKARNVDEVITMLDSSKFKLTFEEIGKIARDWQYEQIMLAEHGKGNYMEEVSV